MCISSSLKHSWVISLYILAAPQFEASASTQTPTDPWNTISMKNIDATHHMQDNAAYDQTMLQITLEENAAYYGLSTQPQISIEDNTARYYAIAKNDNPTSGQDPDYESINSDNAHN